ncbi:MAG: hypothetical protein KC448_07710 [Yoonia sp.]|nr:hypothetical protein [Yoonia sp.]
MLRWSHIDHPSDGAIDLSLTHTRSYDAEGGQAGYGRYLSAIVGFTASGPTRMNTCSGRFIFVHTPDGISRGVT